LSAGLVFTLSAIVGVTNANTNFVTNGFIKNCYQKVDLSQQGVTFNFLNIGGAGVFNFGSDGMPPHTGFKTEFIRIQVMEYGSSSYQDLYTLGGGLSLQDATFNWVNHTNNGLTFPVIEMKKYTQGMDYVINTNSFTFGSYQSVKLTIIEQSNSHDINLNLFETLNEVITLVPSDGRTCFTFDPFSLDVSTILDGLCSGVGSGSSIKLTPSANSPILPYLTSPFPFIDEIGLSGLYKSDNSQLYIDNTTWCDQCINMVAEWYLPDPVPCGCADFDLEFTLYPCVGSSSNCPPIVLTKTIQICCSCDIRSTPPGF
jgi:hypothetical protein